jgi:RecA/RadA recombinase
VTDFSGLSHGVQSTKIETGILPLDIVLGGGYEVGDVIEWSGPSGTGKSTALLHFCGERIRQGQRVAYLDVEGGVKERILSNMALLDYVGTEAGQAPMLLLNPYNFADLERIFDTVLMGPEEFRYDHIVIDSITGVSSTDLNDKTPLMKSAKNSLQNSATKIIAKFLERYKGLCRAYGVTLWMIQQARVKFKDKGPYGMEAYIAPAGGYASEHWPDVRLWLDEGPKLRREEQTTVGLNEHVVYGMVSKLKTIKNRNERPMIPIPTPIIFGYGVSNIMFLEIVLENNKLVTKKPGGRRELHLEGLEGLDGQTCKNLKAFRTLLRENKPAVTEWLRANKYLNLVREGETSEGSVEAEEE